MIFCGLKKVNIICGAVFVSHLREGSVAWQRELQTYINEYSPLRVKTFFSWSRLVIIISIFHPLLNEEQDVARLLFTNCNIKKSTVLKNAVQFLVTVNSVVNNFLVMLTSDLAVSTETDITTRKRSEMIPFIQPVMGRHSWKGRRVNLKSICSYNVCYDPPPPVQFWFIRSMHFFTYSNQLLRPLKAP